MQRSYPWQFCALQKPPVPPCTGVPTPPHPLPCQPASQQSQSYWLVRCSLTCPGAACRSPPAAACPSCPAPPPRGCAAPNNGTVPPPQHGALRGGGGRASERGAGQAGRRAGGWAGFAWGWGWESARPGSSAGAGGVIRRLLLVHPCAPGSCAGTPALQGPPRPARYSKPAAQQRRCWSRAGRGRGPTPCGPPGKNMLPLALKSGQSKRNSGSSSGMQSASRNRNCGGWGGASGQLLSGRSGRALSST